MKNNSRRSPFKPFRNSLVAIMISLLVSGCGVIVVTTATILAIDVARDRRGASVYWDDNKTEIRLGNLIGKQKQIQNEHVNITVYNGVALLTGEVPDQRDIDDIIDLVKADEGTTQVINRLELAGKTNMNSRANDGWLTTKVKTAIAGSDFSDSTRVKVVTERANVYLMGLVKPAEAQIAVDATRGVTGVVRVIKVFEYIEED
ncbi:MAG: BON domain-containing protein [Proteobacteria bacterium]|jgi:osmotically-inducible protein OsmY|nr:BON domain-containing protein [Pseudomonadota bacterium]MBT6065387.1 BON domain-containing protein [Pseudomonadota bacterium]MBT6931210.1 BON domain-containing protein [Pseudomonadota bacterium]MBT7812365.1 BON domain-containing protein [Pseudomonadota bacterium]MBT7965881.1 BON domain-containing protein [Pseudomonadota bacterium]